MTQHDRDTEPPSEEPRGISDDLATLRLELDAQPPRTEAAAPAPDTRRPGPGRYVVTGELGRGGMGIVLEARDEEVGRSVAVKVLEAGAARDPSRVARFLAEARVQGRLDHPGICPVHDMGVDDRGRPWFAMKRIRGRSLRAIVDAVRTARERGAEPPFGVPRLMDLFLRVCDAVAFAHARGVVHRDLKPENVMVGDFGEVQVMDWGLARALDGAAPDGARGDESVHPGAEGATRRGSVAGTPAYMSPEQARGDDDAIDERSDVYALGAMLHHLLALAPPFAGADAEEILARVREGRFDPPLRCRAAGEVPVELDAVVRMAMAHDPAERYASVRDLAADVEAWRSGRLVRAARYGLVSRSLKWLRRHPRVASATAAAFAAALLAAAFVVHRDGERERARTELAARDFETRREGLEGRFAAALRGLDALGGEAASPLVEPSGELATEAVEAWFGAHDQAYQDFENLDRHLASAPEDDAALAMTRRALDLRRGEIVASAVTTAAEIGAGAVARAWLARTRGSAERRALEAEVAAIRERRRREDLEIVEDRLERARSGASLGREFLDFAAAEIARRRGPHVVARLLRSDAVDAEDEWVRRLAYESLGRLGDARSAGASGEDAVEALLRRLQALDPERETDEAVALAEALAHLGDARAFETLFVLREASGTTGAFRRRTDGLLKRLPLPRTKESPNDAPEALVDRARRSAEHGDVRRALQALDRALELDPDCFEARLERGILRMEEGAPAEAVPDLLEAVRLRPESAEAWYELGCARLLLRESEEALRCHDRALERDPNLAAAWNGRARALEDAGRLEEALEAFDRAVALDPRDGDLRNNRGIVKYKLGRAEEAIADYAEAIRLRPERPLPHGNRGLALARLGRLREAVEAYGEALRRDPDNILAYNNRGLVLRRLGEPERALLDYDRAVALAPEHPVLRYNRALGRQEAGRLREALEDLDEALRLLPEQADYLHSRGVVHMLLGDQAAALRDLDSALLLAPDHASARADRGQIHALAGRSAPAVLDLVRVLSLRPEDRLSLGRLLALLLRIP